MSPGARAGLVVLLAGLAVVLAGVVLAVIGRPADAWLWLSGIVLIALGLFRDRMRGVKAGPAGIELAIAAALSSPGEQLASSSQAADLKLLISSGIPVGAAETIMGTDYVIQVTAVNTSAGPIGVSSLGLSLSDGRYIPAMETMPTVGNIKLPAVLKPQESATTWLNFASTASTLAAEGLELRTIIAYLVDGTKREEPVPDGWRRLDDS